MKKKIVGIAVVIALMIAAMPVVLPKNALHDATDKKTSSVQGAQDSNGHNVEPTLASTNGPPPLTTNKIPETNYHFKVKPTLTDKQILSLMSKKAISQIPETHSPSYVKPTRTNDQFGLMSRKRLILELFAQDPAPVFGTPSPLNGSVGLPLSFVWSISITDPDGNLFDWTIQCSNGQANNGVNETNGTKSLSLVNLSYATMYKVWVNATDPTGSGLFTRAWFTFSTMKSDLPPVFGAASPANGSVNNPLSLVWSIPISDPEGDLFSWSIQCSNGQMMSAVNASNGTKSLALVNLSYSTVYTVWVNATDPNGSGLFTRAWYVFTTRAANLPPVFGTPSPANGSKDQPLSFTWSIPIADPEGDLMNWTIQCSNGQTTGKTGEANGTKSLNLTGLSYSATYKVWVNATDPMGSGVYSRAWFMFSTMKQNLPPVFGTPSPVNGSLNQPLGFTWSIPISDPDGDLFNWSIQCSNGQMMSMVNASNGTKSLVLVNLSYSTLYRVWVNATDPMGSGVYSRAWFVFSTMKQNLPPVFGTPSPINGSINNSLALTWSIPIHDPDGDHFSWTIQCSNGQTNSGTNATNGTKHLSLSGLAFATTYKVWVNATDPNGSGLFTRAWYTFTTRTENLSVTIQATPDILWPPNHKMRDVLITGSSAGAGTLTFADEDEYEQVEPTLTGFNQTIQLQAWRRGNDMDGRTYTITVTLTDAQGHSVSASTIVLVPHDMGQLGQKVLHRAQFKTLG